MNFHRNNILALKAGIVIFTLLCVVSTFNWWWALGWVAAGALINQYQIWLRRKAMARIQQQAQAILADLAGNLQEALARVDAEIDSNPDSPTAIVNDVLSKASRHDH